MLTSVPAVSRAESDKSAAASGFAIPTPEEKGNAEECADKTGNLVDLRERDHRSGRRCGGKNGFGVVVVHFDFRAMRSPNHHPTQLNAAKLICSTIGARSGPTEWK